MIITDNKKRLCALLMAALLLFALFFAHAGTASAESEESAALTEVEAATVDEFLKAIAPNTVITLTGRSYAPPAPGQKSSPYLATLAC